MTLRIRVGKNIRGLRQQRGWSCEYLGGLVGLTRGGVSAIEIGRVCAPLETCERFAQAFAVPLSAIIPLDAVPRGSRRLTRKPSDRSA